MYKINNTQEKKYQYLGGWLLPRLLSQLAVGTNGDEAVGLRGIN